MIPLRIILFLALAALEMVGARAIAASPAQGFSCDGIPQLSRKELQEVVRKAQDAYANIETLTATFSQNSFLAALELSEESGGTFIFQKPGKMRWNYQTPENQLFITDNGTLWLYQEAEKQVVIDQFRNQFVTDLPVSFLMGIGNLAQDFEPVAGCQLKDGIVVTLRGVGKEEKESLRSFDLLVDSSEYLPRGARVADVGGNVTGFLFSDRKTNLPVDLRVFQPEFPEGTDYIDRRT